MLIYVQRYRLQTALASFWALASLKAIFTWLISTSSLDIVDRWSRRHFALTGAFALPFRMLRYAQARFGRGHCGRIDFCDDISTLLLRRRAALWSRLWRTVVNTSATGRVVIETLVRSASDARKTLQAVTKLSSCQKYVPQFQPQHVPEMIYKLSLRLSLALQQHTWLS